MHATGWRARWPGSILLAVCLLACTHSFVERSSPVGAVTSGQYVNLFALAGHEQSAIDAKIRGAFQQLFHGDDEQERVYYPAGSNADGPLAYIHDVSSGDVRSEGMSYGMMIAVQLDRKAEFDALWNWARTYMYRTEAMHPARGYFSWSMQVNGAALDEMPAPDGEEYFVTALYFAAARWGNGAGIYDYRAAADRILIDILHREPITGASSHSAPAART